MPDRATVRRTLRTEYTWRAGAVDSDQWMAARRAMRRKGTRVTERGTFCGWDYVVVESTMERIIEVHDGESLDAAIRTADAEMGRVLKARHG